MAKKRAYGADAKMVVAVETVYGVAPAAGTYFSTDIGKTDLSSEIKLGDSPLLGRGRDSLDPWRGLVTDEGGIDIPIDVQGVGFWLNAMLGAPTSTGVAAASGSIAFSAQPAAASTITINSIVYTFVASAPGTNDILIGADLPTTLTAAAAKLSQSANPLLTVAAYASTATALTIAYTALGALGNAFTLAALAASNGTPSGATLSGGLNAHVFKSGSDTIPSLTIEIGHTKLLTPVFFRHSGAVVESLDFDLGKEGAASATLKVVAQGEDRSATTIDPNPKSFSLTRFSQGKGYIKRGATALAGVTAGKLSFSNTLERVRTIRADGRIDGADPTIATIKGSMTLRFDGVTLVEEAANGDPISLEYGFTSSGDFALSFLLPRVFIPKPKYMITGAGGVESTVAWHGSKDPVLGAMMIVTLTNDVVSY